MSNPFDAGVAARHPLALMMILGLVCLFAGCSKKVPEDRAARSDAAPPKPGSPAETLATSLQAQLIAMTNQLAAARVEQAETVKLLINRLEQLEQKAAAQSNAAAGFTAAKEEQTRAQAALLAAHQEQANKFVERIQHLEGQVTALQQARLLPEIDLPADDQPTVAELDQKIRVAERKQELAAEAAEARAKEQPQLSIGQNGLQFRSADTNFTLRVGGLVQLDSRTFFGDDAFNEGNDTFALRRARPIVEGTFFRDFGYQLVSDFAGSGPQIFEANLSYRPRPEWGIRAGKFKGPVGLESLQSDSTLPFNERGFVSALAPVRNVGLQLEGSLFDGLLDYSAGVFNVTGDSRNSGNVDFGDDKEFAGRLFVRPLKSSGVPWLQELGFGVGGSFSQVNSNALALPGTTGGTLPGYTTPTLQQFFSYNPLVGPVVADGDLWRISPHLQYRHGPFGLLGEYAISKHGVYNSTTFRAANLEHSAWQVSAQYVLTGEPASFTGITPTQPFSLSGGGWGAWQLVGRYGQLDIDDAAFLGFSNPDYSAKGASSWSVGVNWWLNRNVRMLTSFTHTSFEGGASPANPAVPASLSAPSTVTRNDENALLNRIQVSF